MRAALALLDEPDGPVLVGYAEDIYSDQDIDLTHASSAPLAGLSTDVEFEVTTLRAYYEQWVATHAGRTTVRVTRVDQRCFRGLVRLLETFVEGQPVDVPEWNRDVPLPQFLRWATDDLKASYVEARMQQKADASFQELNRWLWSETRCRICFELYGIECVRKRSETGRDCVWQCSLSENLRVI